VTSNKRKFIDEKLRAEKRDSLRVPKNINEISEIARHHRGYRTVTVRPKIINSRRRTVNVSRDLKTKAGNACRTLSAGREGGAA
jgi:hypothetical protein